MKMIEMIMIGIMAISLMSCGASGIKYEGYASRLLTEKYGERFEIKEYYGRDWMDDEYELAAVSVNHPDILFEVKGKCDGSSITDEYVASRVCRSVEKQIEQNLEAVSDCIAVKVQAISKSIDSTNADMSVQEFVSMKSKNRFVIYLHYAPPEGCKENIGELLQNSLSGLECMNGTMQVINLSENKLEKIREYLANHAKVDNEYKEMVEGAEQVSIPFSKGLMDFNEGELF